MSRIMVVGAAVVAMAMAGQPGADRDGILRGLVDTERQFAHDATEKGIRDSFLEFFAADAVALAPEPQSAVARLRARPSRPFAEAELIWEPRAGDAASAGDLGWLTGPSTYVDHTANALPTYGNYLSVWRRQPDGAWRVFLDIGTSIPFAAPFAAGFSTVRPARPWMGGRDRRAGTSLTDAERTLNARILSVGMERAYGSVVAVEGSRLHRQEAMPQVGRPAIVEWLATHPARWAPRTLAAQVSGSGDLAYTYGTYLSGANRGGYVRIWARDGGGRWWLMADVATAEQPAGASR